MPRTGLGAGLAPAASCVLLAGTAGGAGAAAVTTVVVAGLPHPAGELGFVAAEWGCRSG